MGTPYSLFVYSSSRCLVGFFFSWAINLSSLKTHPRSRVFFAASKTEMGKKGLAYDDPTCTGTDDDTAVVWSCFFMAIEQRKFKLFPTRCWQGACYAYFFLFFRLPSLCCLLLRIFSRLSLGPWVFYSVLHLSYALRSIYRYKWPSTSEIFTR